MRLYIEEKLINIYTNLEDHVLIDLFRNGDSRSLDFIINKYERFVHAKARIYFIIGAEHEDIVQEGMLGLYKAICDFKEEKTVSFMAFAELCITRQIQTAVKASTRQKHGPLNSYVSLDKPLYNQDSTYTLIDMLREEKISNPETLIINQDQSDDIGREIAKILSDLDKSVLSSHVYGLSYKEISEELNISTKSIDNALQRVKRKLSFLEKE